MNIVVVRARRKSMTVTVNRGGEVVVRAPYGVSREEIRYFIEKHRDWIFLRQEERLRGQADLSDGASYNLFGRQIVLASGKLSLTDGVLYLPQKAREAAFRKYLIGLAKDEMLELTERLAEEFGFRYGGVRISAARTRWGSCNSRGVIAYSFRVAFLPLEAIRAIAVHELCHTRVFHHGPKFWAEVERIIPDYSALRKVLKSMQYVMNYL